MEYLFLDEPTHDEVNEIIGLYKDAGWWDDGGDNETLIPRIIHGSHLFAVAKDEGKIIAMGRAISDHVSDAYLQDITVHISFRGKGIAKELLQRMIDRLTSDKIRWVALIAERGSFGLYERVGFKTMANSTPMLRLDNHHDIHQS